MIEKLKRRQEGLNGTRLASAARALSRVGTYRCRQHFFSFFFCPQAADALLHLHVCMRAQLGVCIRVCVCVYAHGFAGSDTSLIKVLLRSWGDTKERAFLWDDTYSVMCDIYLCRCQNSMGFRLYLGCILLHYIIYYIILHLIILYRALDYTCYVT